MSCNHCVHYALVIPEAEGDASRGLCRRLPPVPVVIRLATLPSPEMPEGVPHEWTSLWPSVRGDALCGEFRVEEESKT